MKRLMVISARTLVTSCVCLLVTTATPAAFAQPRLFVRTASEVVELDPRPALLGTVIRRFALPAGVSTRWSGNAVSFAGGQFLVWTTAPGFGPGGAVVLLNTRSGAVHQVAWPEFSPTTVLGTDGFDRLLVLGHNYASGRELVLVADARSGSMRFLDMGRIADYQVYAYAPASDLLFVSNPVLVFGGGSNFDIDVIHASTGTLLKTIHNPYIFPNGLLTDAAGTRLFVSDELRAFAFDVASGTLLASNTFDQFVGGLLHDERRNRLIASVPPHTPDYLVGISAFSADSLQLIGTVQVPKLPLPPPTPDTAPALTQHVDFSGLSATLFVLQAVEVRHKYGHGYECHESQLIALDAGTGRLRQTVSTTDALGFGSCGADLVRITEPAPPIAGTLDVAGHQVTLTWEAPFGATHYELEVGTAPGLTNIGTVPTVEPRFVVNDVPSGTYYVRVRAINTIGKSSASREVQIVVP
jgi:hypothetical protein